jgi:hypothetical protein
MDQFIAWIDGESRAALSVSEWIHLTTDFTDLTDQSSKKV